MSQAEGISNFKFSVDKTKFKLSVGIFALVGAMLGLTGAFAISYFSGSGGSGIISGLLSAVVLTIGFLIGPVIAIIVALRIQSESQLESDIQYATSATSAFIGYIVMVIILALVLSLAAGFLLGGGGGQTGSGGGQAPDSGSGSGGSIVSLGDLLLPLIGFAIPTGLTGAGTVWIAGRFSMTREPSSETAGRSTEATSSTTGGSSISPIYINLPSENPLTGFRESLSDISYPLAAIFGVVSILASSLLMILLIVIDPVIGETNASLLGQGIISVSLEEFGLEQTRMNILPWLSWMVLHAHGVEVQWLTFELIRMSLFRTVPWVVLLFGGYVTAKLQNGISPVEAFVNGGSIAVSYVVMIFVFALLTPTTIDDGAANFVTGYATSVDVIGAVLKAGIIYPIIFGGIGGLAHFYRSDSDVHESNSDKEQEI
jgi:hypothetical protein